MNKAFVVMVVSVICLFVSCLLPSAVGTSQSLDDPVGQVMVWESFENGFPPENWTNTGWVDSLYGEPYHGSHWAYSWAAGCALTTPPLEFGMNTTLTFWYRAESSYHPQDLEVYVNDTLVWSDYGLIHDHYIMQTVHLDSFSGLKDITFLDSGPSDFYGKMVDLITVTTGPVVYVDDDFNSSTPGWQYDHFDVIQDGIDAAGENATVYVFNGTYYESIIINKTMCLIGEDSNNTIIEGNNENYVLSISADFTTIMNVEIKNNSFWSTARGIDIHANYTTIKNNFCNNLRFGIYVAGLNNTIKNNNISSINYVGVHISSDNNHVFNNYVNSMGYCIFLDHAGNNTIHQNQIPSSLNNGLYLDFSNDNKITNNTIHFHGSNGVYLDFSKNNTIKHNNISYNDGDGVLILGSSCTNNSMIENHIFSNNRFGIELLSSSNNYVFHNEFKNNNENANDTGNNYWDDGYPSGGNYWDDYYGSDADGDGIGDIPYNISGGDNQDLYPFIEKDGWLKTIDVDQNIFDRGFPIRHALDGDWAGAQSFQTSSETLTRVDVSIRKFGTPEFNLTLEIREDAVDGNLIESFEYPLEYFDSNWQWLNLDIDDRDNTTGKDYFIVCPPAPSGVTTSFGYEWGYAFGDQYADGSFWFTRDGGGLWRDLPSMYEFVFRTYGYN